MAGSLIVIEYDGIDISGSCVFAECTFEAQMAAVPGVFQVVVRDMGQTLDFTTGQELTLDVDGVRLYGGYVTQVSKTYFFPADDTTDVEAVESRQWILSGVDYNWLFDKLVLRNTTDYTHSIDVVTGSPTDGEVIRDWFDNYFDLPAGFDFSDPLLVLDNHTFSETGNYAWPTQGATMRQVLDNFALYGSVVWLDADRKLNFMPVQDTAADWGFSDKPNNDPIGVGTPTYGFRDGEFIEDASPIVNDALVWGGSKWSPGGSVVFARRENATSVTAHGRWQVGEVRVGEAGFKTQTGVTGRAKSIVDGNESGIYDSGSQGLVNPEKQFRCTWFSTDVPEVAGDPVHLKPGQVVPIRLWVFSEDAGVTPFAVDLPLRQLNITFPTLDPGGDAYIQFEAFFGVLMSDPHWLWAFLRGGATKLPSLPVVNSADNDSVDPPYGSQYQGTPSPAPDGLTTVFTIPFAYISETSNLYYNGLLQELGTAYLESDPATGEFTLLFTPEIDDELWAEATLG